MKAHNAVVPLMIKAFLASAVLQVPFILMQFSHSRTLEALGTLFFVPSIVLLERLPPAFHLFGQTRESSTLSYLIEVDTLQFVAVGTIIFGMLAISARFGSKVKEQGHDRS